MTPRRRKSREHRPPQPSKQPLSGTVYVPARPCRCGKAGFVSRTEARKVLREMRRRQPHEDPPIQVYRCQQDDTHFHVGHTPYWRRSGRPDLNDPLNWGDVESGDAS